MFTLRRAVSKNLVRPGRDGDEERVVILEKQVQSLSTTASEAMDRAADLENQVQQLKKELYAIRNDRKTSVPTLHSFQTAHISEDSLSSMNSIFSDSSSLTHITAVQTPVTDSSLVADLRRQIGASEQSRQKLENALAQNQADNASLEKQLKISENKVETITRQLRSSEEQKALFNKALERRDTAQRSLEKRIEELKEELTRSNEKTILSDDSQRLRTLEISIRAINSAREALNRLPLHK